MKYIENKNLFRLTQPSKVLEDYASIVKSRFETMEITNYNITFNDIPDSEYNIIGIYLAQIVQGAQNEDIYTVLVAFKVENNSGNPLILYDIAYDVLLCFYIPHTYYIENTGSSVRSYQMIKTEEPISILYDVSNIYTFYCLFDIKATKYKNV